MLLVTFHGDVPSDVIIPDSGVIQLNCLIKVESRFSELESQIKDHSEGFRFVGTDNYKYEWITEAVPYDQFYDWVDLTLTASVDGVTKVDPTIL